MHTDMGRPSEYKEEYVSKADEYLAERQDKYLFDEKTKLKVLHVQLPTIEDFSSFLDVATSSLYVWADQHPEFSEALGKIKNEQKKRLINRGLASEYNSTIAKLILSSNHGMREGSDITTDSRPLLFGNRKDLELLASKMHGIIEEEIKKL